MISMYLFFSLLYNYKGGERVQKDNFLGFTEDFFVVFRILARNYLEIQVLTCD